MLGRNYNIKEISLAVNDVPLTGIQTVNHFNTYFTSVASDLVRNLSNNNNYPYEDNNLNATCVINVISDTQFEFRKKCNTTLAVFHLVANLLKSFHNKTCCISDRNYI